MYMIYKHKIAYNGDNDETRVEADGITTKSRGYLTWNNHKIISFKEVLELVKVIKKFQCVFQTV